MFLGNTWGLPLAQSEVYVLYYVCILVALVCDMVTNKFSSKNKYPETQWPRFFCCKRNLLKSLVWTCMVYIAWQLVTALLT